MISRYMAKYIKNYKVANFRFVLDDRMYCIVTAVNKCPD